MNRRELIAHFDLLSPYTDRMIQRGIETHRKGLFAVRVTDAQKKPLQGIRVIDFSTFVAAPVCCRGTDPPTPGR